MSLATPMNIQAAADFQRPFSSSPFSSTCVILSAENRASFFKAWVYCSGAANMACTIQYVLVSVTRVRGTGWVWFWEKPACIGQCHLREKHTALSPSNLHVHIIMTKSVRDVTEVCIWIIPFLLGESIRRMRLNIYILLYDTGKDLIKTYYTMLFYEHILQLICIMKCS